MKRIAILIPLLIGIFLSGNAQVDSVMLNEVVVTGSREAIDVRHLPLTVKVIGQGRIENSHDASLLPVVNEETPGLFVTSRAMMGYGVSGGSAGSLSVRGLNGGSGQVMVLIDGHPQYNGIYAHPISDSFRSIMAERVEFVRGPASVIYGSNAMGGVMNIVTRQKHGDGAKTHLRLGAGSWGTFQAEGVNMLRYGKFWSVIGAEYGRSDNHRPRMGFEQYGGNVKIGYDVSEHWRTSADVNITHFNASIPGSVDEPLWDADQWITRGVASVSVSNHYDKATGGISAFFNFGRHKIDDGTKNEMEPSTRFFRSRDAMSGVSVFETFGLFRGNRLTLGLDYQHIYGRAFYTSKETGEILETPNKQSGKSHRDEVGVYADFRQDLTSWMTVDAGVRYDYHTVTGGEWIPQVGLVFRPSLTGDLKLVVSKGFRNPSMRELYLYPPSNTDLAPERMWNYEAGWHHSVMNGRLTYGINLFYLKADNIIQTAMIDGRPRNVNSGEIENYGIEAECNWQIAPQWRVSTNHSWLKMEHPVLASPKYKGYLGGEYAGSGWLVRLGLMVVRGLYKSVGETPETENFTMLNAMICRDIVKTVRLWVKGENLLAQRYEINAGYPMPKATFMAGVDVSF